MNGFEEFAQAARAATGTRQRRLPLERLRELVRTAPPTLNATAVLRSRGRAVSVIAEVKRATVDFADLTGVGDVAVLARF